MPSSMMMMYHAALQPGDDVSCRMQHCPQQAAPMRGAAHRTRYTWFQDTSTALTSMQSCTITVVLLPETVHRPKVQSHMD